MRKYKLCNVRMKGNEHGFLRENTVYADLCDMDNNVVISATLEYILSAIRDMRLEVEGVSVSREMSRGADCSTVTIYSLHHE